MSLHHTNAHSMKLIRDTFILVAMFSMAAVYGQHPGRSESKSETTSQESERRRTGNIDNFWLSAPPRGERVPGFRQR